MDKECFVSALGAVYALSRLTEREPTDLQKQTEFATNVYDNIINEAKENNISITKDYLLKKLAEAISNLDYRDKLNSYASKLIKERNDILEKKKILAECKN